MHLFSFSFNLGGKCFHFFHFQFEILCVVFSEAKHTYTNLVKHLISVKTNVGLATKMFNGSNQEMEPVWMGDVLHGFCCLFSPSCPGKCTHTDMS